MQITSFLKLPVSVMNTSEQQASQAFHQNNHNDTFPVSERSRISDITFSDTANIITRIQNQPPSGFPYRYIENNRAHEHEFRRILITKLNEGAGLQKSIFHDDWIIFIILAAAFFYASVHSFSRRFFPGFIRFFLMKGVGDPESRDTGVIFHWQSTVINFISFMNIALFAYFAASHYGIMPQSFSHFAAWLIALGIIIISITARHFLNIAIAGISGEKEVFDEYTVTVYGFYRYLALVLFVIVILLSYTDIIPSETLIISGFISFAVFYLIRVVRLFLIFLKRSVSILYLILYLCALEFLPAAVFMRLASGLF